MTWHRTILGEPRRYVGGWTRAEIAEDQLAMIQHGTRASVGLQLQNEPGSYIFPQRDVIEGTATERKPDPPERRELVK